MFYGTVSLTKKQSTIQELKMELTHLLIIVVVVVIVFVVYRIIDKRMGP
jgi:hypothetical protein